MALLTLVRHGQASFLQADYDRLSELGERQARILGEYWLRTGVVFDQVYHGPACRHLRTGEIVAGVYQEAGAPWPEPITLADLDEYAGIAVVQTFLPRLRETDQDIRALDAEFRGQSDQEAAFRVFDRLFQRVVRMWVDEQLHSPEIETWKAFCARVDQALAHIRGAASRNARIAVFTSGGVIGAAVRHALDLAPQKTLDVSLGSRNASYTEFRFSAERFSLASFNNHPHLGDANLLTYR
ncbi:MAG TPA: histidine phosphatase family protein [Bryobacteraceae bacterium]|nr:histidine phosphatase family protein [Bryobacteraceae bacterium]